MPTQRFSFTLFASVMLCAGAAFAAPVTELKPDQVAPFVARNDIVVVQFTSSDKTCKYCIGAAEPFDEAAALNKNKSIQFVRVQWPVWHKMPKFEPLLTMYGVPRQVVFRKGKEMQSVGGRPASATEFIADVAEVLSLPPAPGKDFKQTQSNKEQEAKQLAQKQAYRPMNAEQQDLTRLMIRSNILGMITKACATKFPNNAKRYDTAYATWNDARKDKLSKAQVLMVTRTSREDANEATALVEVEKNAMQAWQVATTGAPIDRDPVVQDCDTIVAALPALN
jgi:hypothetical protein